jgi:hypothetical protein
MQGIKLRDGWTSELYPGREEFSVLRRPGEDGGFVTINFVRRIFAAGMVTPYQHVGNRKEYDGRGWRQLLVDDAMDWLDQYVA